MGEVTAILEGIERGDVGSSERLLPLVYAELRRLASRRLRNERPGQTLQTTALVHEAYLRLVGQRHVDWKNRAYFFGAVATIMRRILVDHARRRVRDKRGGGVALLSLDQVPDLEGPTSEPGVDVEALDRALDRLGTIDARQARIVELRYFSGMTIQEVAAVMDISEGTVKRDWTVARAWLFAELNGTS